LKTTAEKAPARKRPYHHGNLRQAMVETCVELAEEDGAESVSVRKAARRLGVSSGAPFRHFANRTALMTAVAEEGMRRFMLEIEGGLNRAAQASARERVRVLGHAYVLWALRNPTHFKILSARDIIDIPASTALRRDIRAVRDLTLRLFKEAGLGAAAARAGYAKVELMARALVYGLSRMNVDRHLPQWDVADADAEKVTLQVLDAFLDMLWQ